MSAAHMPSDPRVTRLADPALAAQLSHFVRGRVPAAEVDDIVQSTLADAIASPHAPEDDTELVRWVHGIARHKVADWFRRTKREVPRDPEVTDDTVAAAESAPQSARDLLRWAQRELPAGEDNAKTLEWMLREGAGEKLETIAEEANVPAPRVRQRVSRLRRLFRARWAAQLAAAAAIVAAVIAVWIAIHKRGDEIAPRPTPSELPSPPAPPMIPAPAPEERAAELRRDAFDKCDAHQWRECVDELDQAKELDPAGDTNERVQKARHDAQDALQPAPAPKPAPTDAKDSKPPMLVPTEAPTGSAMPPMPAPPAKKAPDKPKAGPRPFSTDSLGSDFPPPEPTSKK